MYQLHRLHVHMYSTKARAEQCSRQNNDVKHIICSTKEKLDNYAQTITGKNTSIIHDAITLIHLLLTISNSEAIL